MKRAKLQRFFPKTLRWQLILSVTLVHALLMSLFVWDLVTRQKKILFERQQEHALALAETLAVGASHWLAAYDIAGLQELVNAETRYHELDFALISDISNTVLAHTDPAKVGLTVTDFPQKTGNTFISCTSNLVDIAIPVLLSGNHIGWVRLGIGQHMTGRKTEQIVTTGIIYALTAIAIGAVFALLMGNNITGRLNIIAETMKKVRDGDTTCRISMPGRDEAAVLANGFNDMIDQIRSRKKKLEQNREELAKLNETLEEQVAQRTFELKKSLEKSHRSQAELNKAQRVAQVGSWYYDMARNKVSWSDETYRIFGIPKGVAINYDTFIKTIHPEDLKRVKGILDHAGQKGSFECEYRIVAGRQVKWIHNAAEISFNDTRIPYAAIGIIKDITQAKTAAIELSEALELNRKIIDESHSGILAYDAEDGHCVLVNSQAADIVGSYRDELMKDNFHDLSDWKATGLYDAARQAVSTLETVSGTTQVETRFGRYIYVDYSFSIFISRNRPHLLVMFDDITEKKTI